MLVGNKFVFALLGLFAVASCSGTPDVTRAEFQPALAQQQQLSAISRRFQRQLQETVNFDFDKDTLTASATEILDAQANWILGYPEIRFSVFGHTDKVGNNAYNQDLGLRRANRVVAYLIYKGINADRLEALISYGEELPLIDTEARELANRRTTTFVSGYFTPRPGNDVVASIDPEPPVEEPPAEEPPAEEPPAEEPPAEEPPVEEPPVEEPPTAGKPKHNNAGRGNGDEDGDPGNSEGHNKGGDELP